MDTVLFCESIYNILFVLIDPLNQITGDTNIQSAVFPACKNINVR